MCQIELALPLQGPRAEEAYALWIYNRSAGRDVSQGDPEVVSRPGECETNGRIALGPAHRVKSLPGHNT
jgi:hypothetical protein